jgi:hypothetical protein
MNRNAVCFKDKHKRFMGVTLLTGSFSVHIQKELINSILEDFNGF